MQVFITGIGGLIGSAVAEAAHARGDVVAGVDSDARGTWFGSSGSVAWRIAELRALGISITDGDFRAHLPMVEGADLVVHCASQPSHDFSRAHVLLDSEVNYLGTVALLEAVRLYAPKATVVFLSTNKVYGDRVNHLPWRQRRERMVLTEPSVGVDPEQGISEAFPLDASLHTPFGVSKLGADLMVQEYARAFGLTTVVLRCGCLTGPEGSATEAQGFLGYLVDCAVNKRPYTVYGFGGLQVRDNIAASDVASAVLAIGWNPTSGVYNLGGGPRNAVSVREALRYLRDSGYSCATREGPARLGDHRWWVTDTRRFEAAYPTWRRQQSVWGVLDAMVRCAIRRRGAPTGHATVSPGADDTTRLQ